ncbi:MAG: hypothetical protein GY832_36140, partial [Chloroflexi bacterium]|nr:hypothetical protein [Chloroflexota bacterium]
VNVRQRYQSNVGRLEQMLDQSEAQVETDRRAMLEECHKAKWEMNDTWTVWAQKRQAELMDMHKEAADESARRINELEWQNNELQKQVHVSESAVQSRITCQPRRLAKL